MSARIASPEAVAGAVRDLPERERLGGFLRAAGCAFHDAGGRLVARPAVSLALVGGMPADRLGGAAAIRDATNVGMGLSAFMSYLSVPGGTLQAAARHVAVGRGERSITHTAHVGVLVAGVTLAAEAEFCTQRDLVHLSRITVARTVLQSRPSLVVPPGGDPGAYAALLAHADAARDAAAPGDRDALEAANLLYPACKATGFLLSGTLRNFGKLVDAAGDTGKEAEYRAALLLVAECLGGVWPDLFGPSGRGGGGSA